MLSCMRFAGFSWQHNPIKIYADHKLITTVVTTAAEGEQLAGICEGISHIRGEGELVGKDCLEQYSALKTLFEKRRRGVLSLPGFEPFTAYFTKLSVEGQDTPDVLKYSFEFMKDRNYSDKKEEFYVCSEGDTLYDISYKCGVDMEELILLNPSLRCPFDFSAGERVRVC